jgi:hypothetical protein
MAKKSSRRSVRRHRTRRHRKMRGGESAAAPVGNASMAYSAGLSLAQGRQYAAIHKDQHGGGSLNAGAFPDAVTTPGFLSNDPGMLASARQAPLIQSLQAVSGLKDYAGQAGGKRRKSRKGRKPHRKSHRVSHKGRKGRKTRKTHMSRKSRKLMYGGQMPFLQPQSINASGMLLSPAMEAKAVSGMNREWELANDPKAFAPGYTDKPSMSQ